MSTPLVSVIIPVYNTGASAVKLIQILLNSSYQNLEIIVVDDGSTDNSLKYLRAIQDPLANSASSNHISSKSQQLTAFHRGRNSRLRILHQKNAGASAARNLGIKHATGRYIAFFDSDDSVNSEIITQFVQAFQRHPETVLVTCAYHYHRVRQGTTEDIYTTPPVAIQPDDTFKAYILKLLLADGRLYAVINKLFRADIIQRHHLIFDTTLNFAEDTKFVLEYLNYSYGDIFLTKNPPKTPNNRSKNPSSDIKSPVSPSWRHSLAFISEPLYHYNYGTTTSTVASSSLPWQNWQTSYNNLVAWLTTSASDSAKSTQPSVPTSQEQKLLHRVLVRWRISHALAVGRANLSLKAKRKYLSLPKLFLAKVALLFRK